MNAWVKVFAPSWNWSCWASCSQALAFTNTLIASTEGNANVPGFEGVKVGLNVYKAKKP